MSIKIKRTCLVVVFAALLLPANLFSQAGGASVPFLRISPDARASGMGETGTAIADNANAVFWNPGGLGFLDYFNKGNDFEDPVPFRQISLSFSPWLPQFNADLYYSYVSAVNHFEGIGTVAANFKFMNLGEFIRTDANGQKQGKFTSNEFAFLLSFGTKITKDLGVGANLQYIRSNLTPAIGSQPAAIGNSAALDLGILWKPHNLWILEDNLALGFNLQNLGPKITYITESDPLPTNLKIGLAYTIFKDEFNDLKMAVDLQKLLVKRDAAGGSDPVPISLYTGWKTKGIETAFGLEYWYEKVFAMRAGYFTEPSNLGGRQFWNLGTGFRYKIFQLDFGYILTINENHPLANTMRFSMLINWQ